MEPKPAFDDPSFHASLAARDRGRRGEDSEAPPPSRNATPPERTSAPVMPPIFPESALLPQPTAPVTRSAVPPVPPRPLLDLFPPAPGRLRARAPSIGGTLSPLTLDPDAPASTIDDTTTLEGDDDFAPLTSGRRMTRTVALAVVFILLMLAGAGAAAWVFRDEVSRLRSQWQSAPR